MAKGGRASRRRFRLLPTVLLTAAILGVPTAVYAWGRSSSSFSIEKVRVTGTTTVSKARVQRLLREEYRGRNLFTVTQTDVAGSLKSLRYVEDVRIDRDFPHMLRVEVIEHRPTAHLLAGGRWYVLADDAFVICPVTAKAKGGDKAADIDGEEETAATTPSLLDGPPGARFELPGVTTEKAVKPGATVSDPLVSAALEVIVGLPDALRDRLRAVKASEVGLLELRLSEGLRVEWGDAQRTAAKTIALRAVLKAYEKAGQEATFVDVSVPDRVLAKPVLE